jgi:hypothetical protein
MLRHYGSARHRQLFILSTNNLEGLCAERLLLQCPKLKDVHVSGCRDMLIGAVRNQVLLHQPCWRRIDKFPGLLISDSEP